MTLALPPPNDDEKETILEDPEPENMLIEQNEVIDEKHDDPERLLVRLHDEINKALDKYELVSNPQLSVNRRENRAIKLKTRFFMETGMKRIAINVTQIINGLITSGLYTKEDFIYTDEELHLNDANYLEIKKLLLNEYNEDKKLELFHALLICAESVIGSETVGIEPEITEPSMGGSGMIEEGNETEDGTDQ